MRPSQKQVQSFHLKPNLLKGEWYFAEEEDLRQMIEHAMNYTSNIAQVKAQKEHVVRCDLDLDLKNSSISGQALLNEAIAQAQKVMDDKVEGKRIKGLVVPHGKLSQTVNVSACSYKHLKGGVLSQFRRVLIIAPAHYEAPNNCLLLTRYSRMEAPFVGAFDIDWRFYKGLVESNPDLFQFASNAFDLSEFGVDA